MKITKDRLPVVFLKLRKLVLWIPVLVLLFGGGISYKIYQNLKEKERLSARAESAQRFQEMLNQLDLQFANSMLRVQSYEEYIGSKPKSYLSDASFIGQALEYTLFQRLTVVRNVHDDDPVTHLPKMRVLVRVTTKNSSLPIGNAKYVQAEELLRSIKSMTSTSSAQQVLLYDFKDVPIVGYVLRSKSDPDVFFIFTTTLGSVFAKMDLRRGESAFITDELYGKSWRVEHRGTTNEVKSDPANSEFNKQITGHQHAFSDTLPQTGFKLRYISDLEGTYNKLSPASVTGIASLTITLIISFLFLVLTRQNSLVTRLVIERTRDLEKVQHELQETLLGKSRFLGNISHEIRTPLNLILGMIDLCDEDEAASDRMKQYLKTMRSSGNHLLSMIEDLLDLAKSDSNELQIQNKKVNLTQLVEELARTAGPDYIKKNLRFYTQIPCNLPLGILCDPSRLRQILMNLLRNACKYTNTGYVALRIYILEQSPEEIKLRFEVEDTGIGIPDDKMGKIFDAFFQIEGSYVFSEGGVGLGLAIVKELVQKLGGHLEVRSHAKTGSTFQVDLSFPIADNQNWSETFKVADDKKRTLLLVSDDPKWLESVNVLSQFSLVEIRRLRRDEFQKMLANLHPEGTEWVLVDFDDFGSTFDNFKIASQAKNLIFAGNKNGTPAESGFSNVPAIENCPILTSDILLAMGFSSRSKKRKEISPEKEISSPAYILPQELSMIIADDDIGNQELYMAYFKNAPWKIKYAMNGKEALDLYMQTPSDLILLDVRMPVMDGFEAVEKIREFETKNGKPEKPIILVTADALSSTADRALLLSNVSFLTKPIKKSVLLAEIQKVLKIS